MEQPGNQAEAQRQAQLLGAHNQRMTEALEAIPDKTELLKQAGHLRVSQKVALGVIEQENSEQVIVYLARHPDQLATLNTLPESTVYSHLGRLSEQLASPRNGSAERKRIVPSAPISPVGGSSTSSSVPLDQMGMKDFIKTRNKQERAYKERTRG